MECLPFVRGDIHQLEQVVVNLIQNACQSLPDRNKKITVETTYNKEKGEIIVSVTDEGIGIKQEYMGNLTDPFFTTKSEIGGTGLGLSICSSIIKEHDGRLEFYSKEGEGTRVCLFLPVVD